MHDPISDYGLDLRQAVIDHLGPDPQLDIGTVLAEARRELNVLLHKVALINPDTTVTVLDTSVNVAAAVKSAWAAVDLDAITSNLQPHPVTLMISGADFDRLTDTSMQWGTHWQRHIDNDRFEPTAQPDEAVSTNWGYVYWVGDHWQAVMLARAYLDSAGHRYQILWDTAQHPNGDYCGYAILTDYASSTCWLPLRPRLTPTA